MEIPGVQGYIIRDGSYDKREKKKVVKMESGTKVLK